jgi:hypothetical protein
MLDLSLGLKSHLKLLTVTYITRQGMYIQRNIEARSCINCRGKAITVKYLSVCVYSCLSYPAFIAHAPYYIAICNPAGSTTFFHIFSKPERFSGKKVTEHKMCVLIFSTFV